MSNKHIVIISGLFFLSLSTIVFAIKPKPSKICYYPKRCQKIISAEFSTGGGKSSIQYVEITCINNKGEIELLIDRFFSGAGLFSFGRVSMPTWVKFKKWDNPYFECKDNK